MSSGEKKDASDKSTVANRTLAKRIAEILPSSLTKWFSRYQPNSHSADLCAPDHKRRRLSEDPNLYLPTTTCASTNTDSLSATANISPEDAVILKSSLLSEGYIKRNETFVDHNRTSVKPPNTVLEKDGMFNHGRPSVDINRSSGSTFYPGKTMYGGKSNNLPKASPNATKQRNRSIDMKMSGASERIKQLLANYSSPLEEVRRISQFVTDENKSNSSTNMSNVSPQQITIQTQNLHVPSIAKILSIKKKSVLMESTSTARQLLASKSSASRYSPYKSLVSSRKCHDMKRRGSMPSMPSLEVHKECLPYFTFITSSSEPSESENISEVLQAEKTPLLVANPDETEDAQSKNTTESDCFITLDTSDDAVSKKGLSTEISSNCSGKEIRLNVPLTTNWKCEICWVKNDMSTSKCVCCGEKMPQNKISINESSGPTETNKNAVSLSINNDPSFINKITNVKSQEENWECHVCLLKNDKQNSKCICCNATKQSAEKILKSKQVTKSQDENWECNVCLVRNDKNKSKCICCEAEKPWTKKSEIKFNFLPSNKTFKFGINHNDTKQEPCNEIIKKVTEKNNMPLQQFSFGLPPIKPVMHADLSSIQEESSRNASSLEQKTTNSESESVECGRRENFQTESSSSAAPLDSTAPPDATFGKLNQSQDHTANTTIDLLNAGARQQQNTANVSIPQTPKNMHECTDTNRVSVSEMPNTQTETSRLPSNLSVRENLLTCETDSNPSPPSTKLTLGSSSHQNSFSISSTKKIKFKFGNCKTNSTNFGVFTGKFETPKIDSHNMKSSINGTHSIKMNTNCSNTTQEVNNEPDSLNPDNSMSVTTQAPPQNLLPTGLTCGGPTQRENFWPPTNLFSAPQNVPTYQNNQAPQNVPTYQNNQAPQNLPIYQNNQAPQNLPTYQNIQAPQTLPTYQNSQAPQTLPTYQNIQAPQTLPTYQNSQAPQTLPTYQNIQAPQNLPTYQNNQAPPPFKFGAMPYASQNAYNVPTFASPQVVSAVLPTQGFGMPFNNANNPFFGAMPNFGIQSTPSMNVTSEDSGGLFASSHQTSTFTDNGSSFSEMPRQMSGFNFSTGQSSPNAFSFPLQSGHRHLTGTSTPQFQVGSSSAPGQTRRIRKAVRRTTPR